MKLRLRGSIYPVAAGQGEIKRLIPFLKKIAARKIILLSDQSLVKIRLKVKKQFSKYPFEFHEIALEAGEGLKDFHTIYPIYGRLLELKADRDSVLIALGGGSIGDAVGFVASTYLRGIRWIGLPTTLLAQVDSSIGGKTGINHQAGKNLIGSFHQPELVICDTDFLSTLSPREIASGIGEIVKYAITFDPKFFLYLDRNLGKLTTLNHKVMQKAIERSLKYKIKAVELDEFDRKGIREVLNFGHTFGHALETLTDYQVFQHGEAVIWGMRFAVTLSMIRGHLPECDGLKIDALLAKIPVPKLPKKIVLKTLLQAMKKDKKSSQNKVRFVLIKRLGKTVSDHHVTENDLERAFQRIKT